jgi:hypothetical protein
MFMVHFILYVNEIKKQNRRISMVTINRFLKRITYIIAATVVSLSYLLTMMPQGAHALQVQTRSIQMSTSSNAGSAATTLYNVNFNSASVATYTVKGIVVQFCSNSPIIGDTTCTAPAGLNTSAVTVTTSGTIGASGWTPAAFISNTAVNLTNATGASLATGNTVTFVLNNIQNPTALGTFYARIYTYTTTTGATGYTIANPDVSTVHTDDGGIALATANQITVTAKVQETLLFCVFTSVSTTGVSCPGAVSGMVLGDNFGVLSSTTTDYLTHTNATTPLYAQLGLASNATTGVIVRAKASGTLTSGSNTIAASGAGSGSCTADSAAAGTEQFGFNVTAGSGGTGTQTADAGYACGAGSHSFDTTNLTTTSYGDPVLSTAGPSTEPTSEALVDFLGKASTTTKSGVYTATFTFIATGTY